MLDYTKIKQLNKDKRLIPFIGAGLSMPLGLPSWEALIKELAEELDWDSDVFVLHGNYLQLAEYFEIEKSLGDLRLFLSDRMKVADVEVKKSLVHKILVEMEPKLIYTTNYDTIIETSFKVHGKEHNTVKSIKDLIGLDDTISTIIKFHGDFTDDESLVLTETSYFNRMEFEHALDIKLRADILSNTLLFLGYGLADMNVRYMFYKLYKLREAIPHASASEPVAILVTFAISEVQKKLLNKWNIHVVSLDPIDKTGSLIDFLDQIK